MIASIFKVDSETRTPKEDWIRDVQEFQILSRGGEAPDSAESLSIEYDKQVAAS
jgi:hypothetical protein